MQLIVTTGLDGSGKSTLIDKLENTVGTKAGFLRVPTIDTDKFQANPLLQEVGDFINYLGVKSDREKEPNLKIISIFGAMLLFEDLLNHLRLSGYSHVFCERHPLIDTVVYAKAYIKVLNPDKLPTTVAAEINKQFKIEIQYFENKLQGKLIATEKGFCYDLLLFLKEWFSNDENYMAPQLNQLFHATPPSKIYLLDADPEILVARIEKRSSNEYHESLEVLSKMQPLYPWTLNLTDFEYQRIEANTWEQVDELYLKLIKELE